MGRTNRGCTLADSSNVAILKAVETALAANISVVNSAGNDGCPYVLGIPKIPGVITVSAVGQDGLKTSYSNFGPDVWISAPGGTSAAPVFSTDIGNSYKGISGTSMAAPHVSGVIGLMLAVNPSLTPVEIRQIIAETAQPIVGATPELSGSPTQRGGMGHGLIDAHAAVLMAQSYNSLNPKCHLVDLISNTIVATTVPNGGGSYVFKQVPPGSYKVRCGNDQDDDDALGESGELFDEEDVAVEEDGDDRCNLDLQDAA